MSFVRTPTFVGLLKDQFGRLGYTWDDPEPESSSFVNKKYGFKSKPKPNVGLDFEYKNEAAEKVTKEKQEGGGEVSKFAYTDAEKTKSVLKIDHECSNINSAWTFANDKLVGEVTGTLLDDDWKVNAGVGYETKKAKGEWRCGGFLDFASPDMSGIKAALHVFAQYNQEGVVKASPALNFNVSEEFNIGAAMEFTGQEMKECWPQFVYTPKDKPDARYWLRGDTQRKIAAAGCDQSIRDGIQHTFEARYKHESTEGIMSSPVSVHSGVEYELNDKTSLSFSSNHAADHDCEMEVTHKIDGNWTVSATQSFDASKAPNSKETGAKPYHLGFTATYKL